MLVRTRGYGDSSKPSWLLIKHKDEWVGPDRHHRVRAAERQDARRRLRRHPGRRHPDVWHSNPPAKGGDTGKLFQRIIATALELREKKHAGAPARPMSAAKAAERLADTRRAGHQRQREDGPHDQDRRRKPGRGSSTAKTPTKKTGASR